VRFTLTLRKGLPPLVVWV